MFANPGRWLWSMAAGSALVACGGDGAPSSTPSPATGGTASGGAGVGGMLGGSDTGGVAPGTGGTVVASGGTPASGGGMTAGGVMGSGGSATSGGTSSGGVAGASGGTPAGGTGGSEGGSDGGGGTQAGGAGSGGTGAGGDSGGSSAGAGGASDPVPTTGCGTPSSQQKESFVEQAMLDVDGAMRRWWVWLPESYDENRAYPVVVLLHGCGNETNNVPVQNQSDQDAIVIRGVAQSDCWNTQQNGPDIPFFDAMVEATEAGFCADSSRIFAAGYSSGSHLINALACYRGDVLRGAGTVSGGSPMRNGCTGPLARIFIFDINDMEPGNSMQETARERDRLLELNGCDTSLDPLPVEPAPGLSSPPRTCTEYQGCGAYPVIWCETEGQMHGRQDQFASRAYWYLFSQL